MRIAVDAIELFDGFRFPVRGLNLVAAAGFELGEPRTHARLHFERIGILLAPWPMRRVVAHVAEFAVAHRAHRVVALIHATAVEEHMITWRTSLIAQEGVACVVRRNRHATKAHRGRGEIDEAYRLVHPLAGTCRREVRPFRGETHDERHACSRIVDIAFAAWEGTSVVAVVEDDRVL